MPAYGQQVIPQEQNVPAPLIPKADDTVPNLIGQMGNAGLAAFVSINNHKNQVQLEEKALQQRAVHDQQSFGLEREKMAQDFQLRTRRMDVDKELQNIRSGTESAYIQDMQGFMGQVRDFKGDRRSPEFAALVEKAVYDHPLVLRHPKGIEAFTAYVKPYDEANDVRATLAAKNAALVEAGYAPKTATINAKGGVNVGGAMGGAKKEKDSTLVSPATQPPSVEVGYLAPKDAAETKTTPKMVKGQYIGDPSGDVVRVHTGKSNKDGPIYAIMTKDEYLSRGGKLAPESMPADTSYAGPTTQVKEVRGIANGRPAIFDENTKKFLRWVE